MTIDQRIDAFSKLSGYLSYYVETYSEMENKKEAMAPFFENLHTAVLKSQQHNAWFTNENMIHALRSIAGSISSNSLINFVSNYEPDSSVHQKPANIGVVMAGNIPAVGFHDFLCVLISGNRFVGKCSSDDQYLLPAIARALIRIQPAFGQLIHFCEDRLSGFDAVIATGSNNTSRYFDYYFGKYPHIIRKNRNGVGVLSGNETISNLESFADDIFLFFGLGCRNISKIYLPDGFDPTKLYEGFNKWEHIADHHKYRNNYDYCNSIYLINLEPFYDNGFALLRENQNISSPISVINYEFYRDIKDINEHLAINEEQIQCVVSIDKNIKNAIGPGKAQTPGLQDFADGVDTMKFCLSLR